MLPSCSSATPLPQNSLCTQICDGSAHVLRDQRLAEIHQHLAVVARQPLVPDLRQEVAVLFRVHGPRRDHGVRVIRAGARIAEGNHPFEVPALRRRALEFPWLDDRDELQVGRVELAAQEAVDVQRPRRVVATHAGERVVAHTVAPQDRRSVADPVEGRLALLGDPVVVVDILRTVDAQAHQERVLLEEPRPVLVEQRAVGLKVVLDALAWLRMLLLQRHDLVEELETHQRRLAALPGKHDLVARHARDVIRDESRGTSSCMCPPPGPPGRSCLDR